VEIRVEPNPGANWPFVFARQCINAASAAENPPRTAFFNRGRQQGISGESAPGFEFRPNALVLAGQGDQIAGLAAAQRRDQLRE